MIALVFYYQLYKNKKNTFQSRSCRRKGFVVFVVDGPPLGRHEELVGPVVEAAIKGQLSQQLKVLGVQLESKFVICFILLIF